MEHTLYHGSPILHPVGAVMTGRGDIYHAAWSTADFYNAIEAHRPDTMIPHKDAVFMCGWDDLDVCGGSLDVVLKVKPVGSVSRHDMNWSSEISCLIGDGHDINSSKVREAARAYWSGDPGSDPV